MAAGTKAPAPDTVLAVLLSAAANSSRPATLTFLPPSGSASVAASERHIAERLAALSRPQLSPLPFLPEPLPLGESLSDKPPWTYPIRPETRTPADCTVWTERARKFEAKVAFHGSPGERWWSIICAGGLQLRDRDEGGQQNGRAFGDGVYLAGDLRVALNFATAAHSKWAESGPMESFSVVGVFNYLDDPAAVRKGPDSKNQLPVDYIVVEDQSLVRLTHIMLFPLGSSPNARRPWYRSLWLLLLLAYLSILLVLTNGVRFGSLTLLARPLLGLLGYQ